MKKDIDVKDKLGKTVCHLMKNRTIDEITLKEIFTAADVSRYEFYKHFTRKEDLVEWEYARKLKQNALNILDSKCWSEALYKKFTVYEKYKAFFRNVYRGREIEAIRQHNVDFVRDAYMAMLKAHGADLTNPHIVFACEMAVVGGEEMAMRWILDGMREPKEVMLVLFQESIPKCIIEYFQ